MNPKSRVTTHTHMQRKPKKYKSEESKAREAAHHFGKKGGNPICPQSIAANQREFYRWAECKATEEELRAYFADKEKPYARRRFVEMLLSPALEIDSMFALTNQTHGAPKQPIEVESLPKVECEFFKSDE